MSNPYTSPEDDSTEDATVLIRDAVKMLRVITFALISGVAFFAVVSVATNGFAPAGEPDILSWMGLGVGVLMIANHVIIPPIIARARLKSLASEVAHSSQTEINQGLLGAYRTQHIIACAMLEGAAFLNLVVHMINPWSGSLAAAGVLVGLLIIRIPMETRLQFWLQDRRREISRT